MSHLSDGDDEYEAEAAQAALHYSWGNRPNFKELLDGGKNKLVLVLPPDLVIKYFKDKVHRSCGCAYDSSDCTFFATSPGSRGRDEGTVMAFPGNCDKKAVCVAKGLTEAAAVAVYEPGRSVAVVTGRGIYVFERKKNEQGETTSFSSREVSYKKYYRGVGVTAGGNIVTFCNYTSKIRLLDGRVADGEERVLTSVDYLSIINDALFKDNDRRRRERANCCFMDVVENQLVCSDLQKHVISMWEIEEETATGLATVTFVRAIDVQVLENPLRNRQGSGLTPAQIPLGKCTYVSGIRLDAAGWVMVADADGRTLQIFDNNLEFVTRVETPESVGALPYISAFCIEGNGHILTCDRKSEMGGLRVYMLESQPDDGYLQRLQQEQQRLRAADALCQRMNQQGPSYPYQAPAPQYPNRIQPARDERRLADRPLSNYGYAGGSVNYNTGYNNYSATMATTTTPTVPTTRTRTTTTVGATSQDREDTAARTMRETIAVGVGGTGIRGQFGV